MLFFLCKGTTFPRKTRFIKGLNVKFHQKWMSSDAFYHPRFGADGVFFYFCRQNRLFMTQKEAIIEALKRLGGKAKMSEICKLACEIGDFTGSNAPYNTIRNCIYMNHRDFRKSEQKGWWELVSYQEEIACRDKRIKELEEENAQLRAVKTEDDFVLRFIKKVKHHLKRDRKTVEEIRKLMDALGRSDADKELDDWLQGKDKKVVKQVTKKYIQKNINSQVFSGSITESEFNGGGLNNE